MPIIAADSPGPREVLGTFPGDLFPVGDVAALAALLRWHAENRRDKVPQDLSAYALPAIVDQTDAAYRELIRISRRGVPRLWRRRVP